MMLNYNNIDLNDAKQDTCYPFTYSSTLLVNNVRIPAEYFKDIKVYCAEDDGVPVHIGSVGRSPDNPDICVLSFETASGGILGYARIKAGFGGGFFIFDSYGVLRGHVVCSDRLAAMLLKAIAPGTDTATLSSGDFTLLPQCHMAWLAGHCRAIVLDTGVTRSDIQITPGRNIRADFDSAYELGVISDWSDTETAGINWLDVNWTDQDLTITVNGETTTVADIKDNPVWIGGAHLWLRHSLTSNLRIVPTESGIQMRGVLDE